MWFAFDILFFWLLLETEVTLYFFTSGFPDTAVDFGGANVTLLCGYMVLPGRRIDISCFYFYLQMFCTNNKLSFL